MLMKNSASKPPNLKVQSKKLREKTVLDYSQLVLAHGLP
jgi:hypothetical protein